ncbi:hypothetical protein D9M69_328790 [compost metagenome]
MDPRRSSHHESHPSFLPRTLRLAGADRPAGRLSRDHLGGPRAAQGNPHRRARPQCRQRQQRRWGGGRAARPATAGEGVRRAGRGDQMEFLQGRRPGDQRGLCQRPGGFRLPRRPGGDHRQVQRHRYPPAQRHCAQHQELPGRGAGLGDHRPAKPEGQARGAVPWHRQPAVVRCGDRQPGPQREGLQGHQPGLQRRHRGAGGQAGRRILGAVQPQRAARPRADRDSPEHQGSRRRRQHPERAGRLRRLRRRASGSGHPPARRAGTGAAMADPRGEQRRLYPAGLATGQLPAGDPAGGLQG